MPFSDNLAFIIPTLIKLAFTVDFDTVISWPIVYAWVTCLGLLSDDRPVLYLGKMSLESSEF